MQSKNKTIRIPTSTYNEYKSANAVFLGKGKFNTCWLVNDIVYCFVKHNYNNHATDYSKEGISRWADSDNIHIPQLKKMGESECGKYMIYTMPRYQKLTAQSGNAWQQYKKLNRIWINNFTVNPLTGYERNNNIINTLRGNIDESIINALQSINDALANYGDYYYFEFPKRNLMVNSNGTLILLDVIFNSHANRSYKNS